MSPKFAAAQKLETFNYSKLFLAVINIYESLYSLVVVSSLFQTSTLKTKWSN